MIENSDTNKKVAIILYYGWSSNARGKASGNIYQDLGYDLLIFCTKEKDFSKFREENKAKIWCGIKKYMGNSLITYLFYHLIFLTQSSIWLLTRCIFERPKIVHVHNMPDYLNVNINDWKNIWSKNYLGYTRYYAELFGQLKKILITFQIIVLFFF